MLATWQSSSRFLLRPTLCSTSTCTETERLWALDFTRRIVHLITVTDELLQPLDVSSGHSHFDIIMSDSFRPERGCLGSVRQCIEKTFSMIERDNSIFSSMDYVHGTSMKRYDCVGVQKYKREMIAGCC